MNVSPRRIRDGSPMLPNLDDTIAAIASAAGGGGRGIVRLSGSAVRECLVHCFQPLGFQPLGEDDIMPARYASVVRGACVIERPGSEPATVPCDLWLWPTTRSYTRQPVAELHTIGAPSLVNGILRAVCHAGARLANPGEFTLRAFLAGRIDLTQAEAILGVVDAENSVQLQTALRQMAGGLSGPLERCREELLELLAELEAGLDFADEEMEFIGLDEVGFRLAEIVCQMVALIEQLQSRDEVMASIRVVLIGPPNAGKSSLFNAMAVRYVSTQGRGQPAIVSQQSGTTRDYLAVRLDLDGIVCELIDTAGIGVEFGTWSEEVSGSKNIAGKKGVRNLLPERPAGCFAQKVPDTFFTTSAWRLASNQYQRADIVIDCEAVDGLDSAKHVIPPSHSNRPGPHRISLRTKGDLLPQTKAFGSITTSAHTGEGLAELADTIRRVAETKQSSSGVAVAATAARCRESLEAASESLCSAVTITDTNQGDELIAAEVRTALAHLGAVVGAVYTEDILDRIFSNFCLGK